MSVSERLVWRYAGQPFILARTISVRMAAFSDHDSRGLGSIYNLVAVAMQSATTTDLP